MITPGDQIYSLSGMSETELRELWQKQANDYLASKGLSAAGIDSGVQKADAGTIAAYNAILAAGVGGADQWMTGNLVLGQGPLTSVLGTDGNRVDLTDLPPEARTYYEDINAENARQTDLARKDLAALASGGSVPDPVLLPSAPLTLPSSSGGLPSPPVPSAAPVNTQRPSSTIAAQRPAETLFGDPRAAQADDANVPPKPWYQHPLIVLGGVGLLFALLSS